MPQPGQEQGQWRRPPTQTTAIATVPVESGGVDEVEVERDRAMAQW